VDFITKNFNISDIKTIQKFNFDPVFFLDDNEKTNIIDKAISNIKNKKQEKEMYEELEK